MKELLVNYVETAKFPEVLEADFVVMANDIFHRVSDEVKQGNIPKAEKVMETKTTGYFTIKKARLAGKS